jgi:23S rRNA pseudouridine1911/1915/1917 synthase
MNYRFTVTPGDPTALDQFLACKARLPLKKAQDLITFGAVWVDRRVAQSPELSLNHGQHVALNVPRQGTRRFYEIDSGRIVYRDSWILAYDKEPHIPCQSTPYDGYNDVYAGLRRFLAASPPASDYLGLHHRLDKGVSGVMVFSLSPRANRALARSFREGGAEKVYRAVVSGDPEKDSWVEKTPIGRRNGRHRCVKAGQGKEAVTRFRVINRAKGRAHLEACPETGRTHQIRLHLAHGGLPVLGDLEHQGRSYHRCMLHSFRLSLCHPVTGDPLVLEAPLPEDFNEAL